MALGTTQQELSRPIEPFYDYTNDISANIYISGQTAFCRGEVIGKSAVNKIEAEMTLQKRHCSGGQKLKHGQKRNTAIWSRWKKVIQLTAALIE